MSLSDCEKCWDTPCTCGHMGYTVVFHRGASKAEMKKEISEIKKLLPRLQKRLEELEKKVKE